VVVAEQRPPDCYKIEIEHPGRDASRVLIAERLASLRDAYFVVASCSGGHRLRDDHRLIDVIPPGINIPDAFRCSCYYQVAMSLRPRYSLLTLLVLTALVAGGMKLWYGPHHVVERPEPGVEVEYTYTRDWRGNKIIQGPRIWRKPEANRLEIAIDYYRGGSEVNHRQYLNAYFQKQQFFSFLGTLSPFSDEELQPLQPEEMREFQAAIDQEVAMLRQRGFRQVSPDKLH